MLFNVMVWLTAPPPTRVPRELNWTGPPVKPVTTLDMTWGGITPPNDAVTLPLTIASVTVTVEFRFIADILATLRLLCSSVNACFSWDRACHDM